MLKSPPLSRLLVLWIFLDSRGISITIFSSVEGVDPAHFNIKTLGEGQLVNEKHTEKLPQNVADFLPMLGLSQLDYLVSIMYS